MELKKFLVAAAGAAALWRWAGQHKERALHRKLARAGAKPHEVTTWEGEGGSLRARPQLAPASAERP